MNEEFSYEGAYKRLEEILEKMNSGKLSLDDSLKLFEEADRLIASCQMRLTQAEQKIEKLIKTRENELALTAESAPERELFT